MTTTGGALDPELLRSIDLFAGLDADAIAALAAGARTTTIGGGEVLLREGDPADALYVVRVGRLRATVSRPDGSQALAGHIGRGEVVGEMALISDEPRSATVTADRDSELIRIDTSTFDALVARDPRVLRAIASQVVSRMRRAQHEPPSEPARSVVTVVDADGSPATAEVADRLVAELEARAGGPVAVLSDAPAGSVAELELSHRLVLIRLRGTDDDAVVRAARQSDLVLVVVDAAGAKEPRPVEAALAAGTNHLSTAVHLVLVRPAWMEQALGTAGWLAPRQIERHHHVRAGRTDEVAQVARVALGRAVALVLSGGGARGVAHIGVVRALEELEVPVDAVGGTSMGALVGAAVARGWSWERIAEGVRSGVAQGRGIVDPTLPAVSLAAGHRVTRRLRDAGEGIDIEDLAREFFCVSTNLSTKSAHVHDRGPGWRAVRASIAIPGLFPPVPDGDRVLVDGGLLENFPVARMRARHPNATVIGSDVGTRRDLHGTGLPDAAEVSVRDAVRLILGGRRQRSAVTVARVLARLTELGLQDPDVAVAADALVEPPVHDLGILDFDRFDELVERGYQEALATLGPWARARTAEAEAAGEVAW